MFWRRKESKMKVIEIGNKYYPRKLLDIYNPPKKIYVLGNEKILDNFSIGIVGARNSTKYGEEIAKSLSYNLAKFNINVVSGLAKRDRQLCTYWYYYEKTVKQYLYFGSGFNNIYPKENKKLVLHIINAGGAVITEYEPNILPNAENFPQRNRIIARFIFSE